MLSEVVLKEVENFLYMKTTNTRRSYSEAWQMWQNRETHDRDSALKMFREFKDKNLSDNTLRVRCYSLRAIYEYLIDFGFVDYNPFRAVSRVIKKRDCAQVNPTTLIPFALVNKIVASGKDERDKAILAILFGCGLRRTEAANIRICDIQISQNGTRYLELRQTKAGGSAQQPIPFWVYQHIEKLILKRKTETRDIKANLFVSYANRSKYKKLSAYAIYAIYKQNLALFGLDAAPHSARTTGATFLKSKGCQDRDVARFLRHSGTQMVQTYDKRRLGIEENPGKTLEY